MQLYAVALSDRKNLAQILSSRWVEVARGFDIPESHITMNFVVPTPLLCCRALLERLADDDETVEELANVVMRVYQDDPTTINKILDILDILNNSQQPVSKTASTSLFTTQSPSSAPPPQKHTSHSNTSSHQQNSSSSNTMTGFVKDLSPSTLDTLALDMASNWESVAGQLDIKADDIREQTGPASPAALSKTLIAYITNHQCTKIQLAEALKQAHLNSLVRHLADSNNSSPGQNSTQRVAQPGISAPAQDHARIVGLPL